MLPFALGVAMAGDRVEEGPRVCGAIDHASEAPIGFALAVERDAPAREHLWRSTGEPDRLAVTILLADEIADGVGVRIERCERGLIGREDDCVEQHRRAVLVGRIDRQLTTVRAHTFNPVMTNTWIDQAAAVTCGDPVQLEAMNFQAGTQVLLQRLTVR